jgi:hypothetical protein
MNLAKCTELGHMRCRRSRDYILSCALLCGLPGAWPSHLFAQNSDTAKTRSQQGVRDGQHDFDFYIGTWTQHLKRERFGVGAQI